MKLTSPFYSVNIYAYTKYTVRFLFFTAVQKYTVNSFFFTAVLNGGFSTFLAFILLANSGSHVFLVFFKIFFLVVILGLYFGLAVLPVILSLIGPKYMPHGIVPTQSDENDNQVKAINLPTPIPVLPQEKSD